ncbi:glycosyltransferase family 4 protein [Cellulomonas sp. S1-8]|uniref:glycosyltransferase family 4 protein n=1 Tax=Cellulomonas sp. S1-8 TaxID=2904790 RepID=UPI002244DFAA|nr:glycosyltransferase family 4 protein [Cellulomonas sp. S1-8]UZN04143.1 glycosyltransferase family 4 protein [Cellulomonas sp. S1-8]
MTSATPGATPSTPRVAPVHVLLLTQWFDPEPAFKGLLFARELVRRGHRVTVLTGFPNYPGGRVYDGYRIRARQYERMDGVDVVRVPLYPSHDRSAIKRVLNYVSFAASASVAALTVPRPDVVYVYHPPATVGLPAMVLRWLRGVPFVYDVQDLWPDTLSATGMLRNPTALRLVAAWMRAVYGSAARVTVLSAGFKRSIVARGVKPDHVEVIPNWTHETAPVAPRPSPERARELGFTAEVHVVFAGQMGAAQALDVVLDAAAVLADDERIRFVLIGGGIDSDRLRAERDRRGLLNVELLPRRPPEEIGEILALGDGLLVHLRDDPLFRITVPSKTQAYLRAGRPVLMGVRGDAAELVEQAEAGIAFEPENADDLVRAVRQLASMTADERHAMGARGADYYQQHLALQQGVGRFEALLSDVARTGGRRRGRRTDSRVPRRDDDG